MIDAARDPGELVDMREHLVSDLVGRTTREELIALLRSAPPHEPSARSKRQTEIVERGKVTPPGTRRRLTAEQRSAILAAYAKGDATQTEVAARFGVTQSAVSAIVCRAAAKK